MRKNVVLIGMPGSGKSTVGKLLARKLGMEFCDMDEYIVKKEGKRISELFDIGEEYFRDCETRATEELSKKASRVISTGGGVIKRSCNMECLKRNGIIIFLNRPIDMIKQNIDIETRPLLKDGISKIHQLYDERYSIYKEYCNYEIINNGTPYETAIKIASLLKGKL